MKDCAEGVLDCPSADGRSCRFALGAEMQGWTATFPSAVPGWKPGPKPAGWRLGLCADLSSRDRRQGVECQMPVAEN